LKPPFGRVKQAGTISANRIRKKQNMKTRVGIFEDDKADQFLYQHLFEKMNPGLEGIFFKNIDEGIEAAMKGSFDVVIIDIHYYGDNVGLEILQKLKRASSREFIAIAVTPLLQEGDLERTLEAGFSICLEKPMAFEMLKEGKAI
jgi:CheY-like chemotaxis protein